MKKIEISAKEFIRYLKNRIQAEDAEIENIKERFGTDPIIAGDDGTLRGFLE